MSTKKSTKKTKSSLRPDLPLYIIALLAILTVPRMLAHDLGVLPSSGPSYVVLAVLPFVVWFVALFWVRYKRPLLTFLILGTVYGLLLGTIHMMTWDVAWGMMAPHIAGNFAGQFNAGTQEAILRSASFVSSLLTGIATGAVFGVIAYYVTKNRKPVHTASKTKAKARA